MSDAAVSTWPAPPPALLLAEVALPLLAQRVVKTCPCCGRSFTAAGWLALRYVGQQDDGEGGWLTLRNCRCGSTLAVESESFL